MFALVKSLARATDIVDVNIAAGIARPRLVRTAYLGLLSIILFLSVAVALLWLSYADVSSHLDRQSKTIVTQQAILQNMLSDIGHQQKVSQQTRLKIHDQIVALTAEVAVLKKEVAALKR